MSRSAQMRDPANPDVPRMPVGPRGAKKGLIRAFVLFHLVAIAGWSFTAGNPAAPSSRRIQPLLRWYVLPIGLWQNWDMFAPNPAMSNNYLVAEVTFADGSRTTWKFPRMDELGYFERYRKERHRKWGNERVLAGGKPDPRVAAPAARFAARQVERPGSPARAVDLVRYRAQIFSPKPRQWRPYDEAPRKWERQILYRWSDDRGGAATGPGPTQPSEAVRTPDEDAP